MKRSSEAGPRCRCGQLAEITGPGLARCNSLAHGRYSGSRDFPFYIETRTFYVVDDDLVGTTEPLSGGAA